MSVNFEKTQHEAAPAVAPVRTHALPRVNLMPPEIAHAASFRRTQLVLGGVALAVVAGLAGGYALSALDASKANDELAAEQSTTQTLATEEAKYAHVPKVLGEIDNVKNAQSQAMATDVAWYSQLDAINAEIPAGMTFKSLTVTMNDGSSSTNTGTPNPLAQPGAIGRITLEATTPAYTGSADWLDIAGKHPGYLNQYYSKADLVYNEEKKANVVELATTVDFTKDVLSNRFAGKAN